VATAGAMNGHAGQAGTAQHVFRCHHPVPDGTSDRQLVELARTAPIKPVEEIQ
jgi:hypothetical protein